MWAHVAANAGDFVPGCGGGEAPEHWANADEFVPELGGLDVVPELRVERVPSTGEAVIVTALKGRELETLDAALATRETEAITALERLEEKMAEKKAALAAIRQHRQHVTAEIACREEVSSRCV